MKAFSERKNKNVLKNNSSSYMKVYKYIYAEVNTHTYV